MWKSNSKSIKYKEDSYMELELGLKSSSSTMGVGGMRSIFGFGCRFRFTSAFDSYSVASEAFSEHQIIFSSSSSTIPIAGAVSIEQLLL